MLAAIHHVGVAAVHVAIHFMVGFVIHVVVCIVANSLHFDLFLVYGQVKYIAFLVLVLYVIIVENVSHLLLMVLFLKVASKVPPQKHYRVHDYQSQNQYYAQ